MSSSREESGERRRQVVPASLPRTVLRHGPYVAELIHDRRAHPPLFLTVIQRRGSLEVLRLSQWRTLGEAQRAAYDFFGIKAPSHSTRRRRGRAAGSHAA